MGKLNIFVITLAGSNPVYFAGSNIEGNVIVELSEPKKIQGISIVLSGQAYVHWTEQYSTDSGRSSYTEHYSDSETIFNNIMIQLWGDGKQSQNLVAGRYEFPFKFQFPSDVVLPTSYEGYNGYIRYALTATMSRSWKHNHTTKKAITVNEIIDINTCRLVTPLSRSNEKTVCCLCCASGPISLSVTTDRGGYCSGESIAISTEAENHSNTRVTAVQATLKQVVVYYAQRHSHSSTKVIERIQGPGIEAGGISNWSNELLPIPATVPSICCRILKLSYVLHLTVAFLYSLDLHVAIPITIENVPFRGGQPATNSYPPVGNPPVQTSYPPEGSPYPPPNVNAPPATGNPYPPPIGTPYPSSAYNYSAAYPPVYGFVTDYQFAPPPSYSEAVAKVKGGDN
ncbi:arrestin domain-containing protein 3-like [Dysidea avara]|uniref:arrestin domain-containing protein 3-like n=1 Tax=Dysidea avara TaxID=196820 RepID=UPI003328DEE9